ncbi:MAG: hypothetical protein KatS3mg112_1707 [Thermogutta sp.]|nr:MAG: hypothetical protein KatS3mg112_1707 [Thermogutta sp.]
MSSQTVHDAELETQVQGEKDVNATVIGLIGFVGAIIVFAIIILLQVIYYAWVSRIEARDRQVLPEEIVTVKTEQQLRLAAAASQAGKEAGVLPIDQAMRLVLRDLRAGRPAAEIGGRMQPTTSAAQTGEKTGQPAPEAKSPPKNPTTEIKN